MRDQATIVDFLGASLKGLEKSDRAVLTPHEQQVADQVAVRLDKTLETMVSELEAIASCQQDTPFVEGLDELPPFEAFCRGIERIGEAMLPHVANELREFCKVNKVPPGPFLWILRTRLDAFVAYLSQIAQVHGLAFDDSVQTMGKHEQIALAHLGADLRVLMQRELAPFD